MSLFVSSLWIASTAVLLVADRGSAAAGFALLVYVGGAALLTRRFVAAPKQRAQSEHRQKASRTDGVVIAIAFVFAAFVYGFIANRVLWIPIVGDAWIAFVRSRPPFGATTIANVVLYVVVPTLVLLRVGSALPHVGLGKGNAGTFKATALSLALPCVILVVQIVRGTLAQSPAFVVVRNFLSSGFSEEYLFRGLILGYLSRLMPFSSANFAQAVLFGIFHVASSLDESSPVGLAAYLTATSVIPGYLLGWIRQRTGTLWMPVGIHTALGVLKDCLLR